MEKNKSKIEYTSGDISVTIDPEYGFTSSLVCLKDSFRMNWILSDSDWGRVDGFELTEVIERNNGVITKMKNDWLKVSMTIERSLNNGAYVERYSLTNDGNIEFFVNPDTFGIHFPFASAVIKSPGFENHTCTAHVWCGEEICWLYAVRITGTPPYLAVRMTKGSISEYSISRDISRVPVGADYRGDIVLNPSPCVIAPSKTVVWEFVSVFTDINPQEMWASQSDVLNVSADIYTAHPGEKIHIRAYRENGIGNVSAKAGETELSTEYQSETEALWTISFDSIGEHRIKICASGKDTHIAVNVIPSLAEILEKRAFFIARKQQYKNTGSHLDGAYLCYDLDTDSLYFRRGYDYDAGRERIAMGLIVLRQLQRKPDNELRASIKAHREFLERELLDLNDGTVYNDVLHDPLHRLYNYPWVSTYYLEWYRLYHNKADILTAARILLRFFDKGGINEEAQCIEAYDIIEILRNESENELASTVEKRFIEYVDRISGHGYKVISAETGYTSEAPNEMVNYLSQAYLLTRNKDYLDYAGQHLMAARGFYALQPDFHLNCINVRHWDRYWFGRHDEYGDVFPHHWSMLAATMYMWYDRAMGSSHKKEIRSMTGGNLCIYRSDGFASNNYLYPYHVTLYASGVINPGFPLGGFWGESYDNRANDQDWALYYADTTGGWD